MRALFGLPAVHTSAPSWVISALATPVFGMPAVKPAGTLPVNALSPKFAVTCPLLPINPTWGSSERPGPPRPAKEAPVLGVSGVGPAEPSQFPPAPKRAQNRWLSKSTAKQTTVPAAAVPRLEPTLAPLILTMPLEIWTATAGPTVLKLLVVLATLDLIRPMRYVLPSTLIVIS